MKLLAGVLLLFSILFLALYFSRLQRKGVGTIAHVLNIDEGTLEAPQQYHNIIYYYPLISYQYEIDGNRYYGSVTRRGARKYRVAHTDPYGFENHDSHFFWRQIKVGDKINVYYASKNNRNSWLAHKTTKTYKSETRAFLVLGLVFLMAFIIMLYEVG